MTHMILGVTASCAAASGQAPGWSPRRWSGWAVPAPDVPLMIIGAQQCGVEVVLQRGRHAGDGAGDPAESGHSGDRQQHAGDLVFGRPGRQRPNVLKPSSAFEDAELAGPGGGLAAAGGAQFPVDRPGLCLDGVPDTYIPAAISCAVRWVDNVGSRRSSAAVSDDAVRGELARR